MTKKHHTLGSSPNNPTLMCLALLSLTYNMRLMDLCKLFSKLENHKFLDGEEKIPSMLDDLDDLQEPHVFSGYSG